MKGSLAQVGFRAGIWGGGAIVVLLACTLFSAVLAGAGPAHATAANAAAQQAVPVATPGQDFQDVVPSNGFYSYLHNLFLAGVVGGYTCQSSGTTDPCVPPGNLPYYHPTVAVTRLQMTKFIDLGRRNIADAVGHSLYISTTAGIAVDAETRSGGEAVFGQCLQAGNNCYALEGYAPAGDYAGYMYGGKGVYVESDDAASAAMDAHAYGGSAYGADIRSDTYRGAYVNAVQVGSFSLYVDRANTGVTDLYVNSGAEINGNLIVDGSKTGYVVDVMQNASDAPLQPGDVVVLVGSSAPVLGQIPVVLVAKASSAYDTAVAGVVDQVVYVPDPATRAAYLAQEAAIRAARDAQDRAIAAAPPGTKPDLASIAVPAATISDDAGNLHALADATSAAPGAYLNVVTLGSYKAVHVDATFGPIHVGDLLTTSPHAGYAMAVTDKAAAFGAVIGKALAALDKGTGTIPVMVTLK